MSYLSKRGAVYYFRRGVPDDLCPVIGRLEIMKSLRTKDRDEAKRLVPAEVTRSDDLFAEARKGMVPTPVPVAKAMSRAAWEYEQWQAEQEGKAFVSIWTLTYGPLSVPAVHGGGNRAAPA